MNTWIRVLYFFYILYDLNIPFKILKKKNVCNKNKDLRIIEEVKILCCFKVILSKIV